MSDDAADDMTLEEIIAILEDKALERSTEWNKDGRVLMLSRDDVQKIIASLRREIEEQEQDAIDRDFEF